MTFDIERSDLHLTKELRSGASTEPGRSGHLGFGLGKHFCIGYELARTEAVVGSLQLVERCPELTPDSPGDHRPTIQGNSFQALAAFPMTFSATS